MKQPDDPIIRELGDGLILRRSTRQDAKALAAFNSIIHSDLGPGKPDERVAAWTRDLLSGRHPTHAPGDFTIVEQAATGKIISCMNLISQTWAYEGIPFKVGRPELVGTLPDFRRRGLIRMQFDEIHAWSEARGEMVQVITGIPHYYRQFGYEMGLNLGGGRVGYELHVPALPGREKDPFLIRPAEEKDIPFLMEVSRQGQRRSLVTCVYDEEMWRYVLLGQSRKNVNRREFRVIVDEKAKSPMGYLAHPWYDWNTGMVANEYELKPGVSWLEVTPSVVRYLWRTGVRLLSRQRKTCMAFALWLGSDHPAYDVLGDALPRVRQPYAWFVRVADLPSFLRHIAPVLEKRLAESAALGFSGELKINLYRNAFRMVFEKGRLTGIESWQPDRYEGGDVAFPDLTFLRLVFGHTSLASLRELFPDCWCNDHRIAFLINVLFPKKSSCLFGVA